MIEPELKVIGKIGNSQEENIFLFSPNDNFKPIVFDKVAKLYLIFTEHRVFFVEVKELKKLNSKYLISFNDDGIKEELDLYKSAKLALTKNQLFSLGNEVESAELTGYQAYEDDLLLGKIVDYIYTPGHRVIVIQNELTNEILIPEVDFYLKDIDKLAKRVYFKNTESLREIW